MAVTTTATAAARTTAFVPLSLPKPPQPSSHKFSKQAARSYYRCSSFSTLTSVQPRVSTMTKRPRSVSSPETPAVAVDEDEESGATPSSSDDGDGGEMSVDSVGSLASINGCRACGREEIERGCNGEGRIQGGIATVPGFGWWPIKAYRPCPGYVASGGRYRRTGQSMDEVVSGGGSRGAPDSSSNKAKLSRKKGKS